MQKKLFEKNIKFFVKKLVKHSSTDNGDWTVKGFIDAYENVFSISSDTKIVSKILEIHLFPKILRFAEDNNFNLVLAKHQNYYPDISLVSCDDAKIKYALDFKTTYRVNTHKCNGFTLGSHGKYFQDRTSTKNIQFPYSEYSGHYCLGIIYDRNDFSIDETKQYKLSDIQSIPSVISNIEFFVEEKWKIASDKGGSGNTANIGSIKDIEKIKLGKGTFSELGESWFDDYWMNYGNISIKDDKGKTKKITSLKEFLNFKGVDIKTLIENKSD